MVLCPWLPESAGTRKVKPIWILLKQETVSGSGISRAICKSAFRSRQITMPVPHRSAWHAPKITEFMANVIPWLSCSRNSDPHLLWCQTAAVQSASWREWRALRRLIRSAQQLSPHPAPASSVLRRSLSRQVSPASHAACLSAHREICNQSLNLLYHNLTPN